jgi:hypothetical protein
MAIIKIRNTAIDLDAAEIPNLDASKITTGSLGADRIPNLAASKITSGTFADARIAASNVSQHATSFDDNKIVNDISTLALRQASDGNRSAYNTNSQFVDVFQDSTGITNLTNAVRKSDEYVISAQETFVHQSSANSYTEANIRWIKSNTTDGSTTLTDSSSTGATLSAGNVTHSTTQNKIGTSSLYFNNYSSAISSSGSNTNINSQSNYTISYWIYPTDVTTNGTVMSYGNYGNNAVWMISFNSDRQPAISTGSGWLWSNHHRANFATPLNQWTHHQWVKTGGNIYFYQNGVLDSTLNGSTFTNGSTTSYTHYIGSYFNTSAGFQGYLDEIRMMTSAETPSQETFGGKSTTLNATGSFENNAITAPSSVSSMGAIITYQDNAGTNALNTDIVLKLSADGTNFTTATLTALPDFSTGIKMAKVNDLSVTAGTSLKYKIEFANQASGSKEARIRGVSLQY